MSSPSALKSGGMTNARILTLGAAAMATLAAAAPAAAQAAPDRVSAFTKTSAILGGPSRLAEILAGQGAPVRAAPVQPASFGFRRTVRPVAQPAVLTTTAAAPRLSSAILSGRPDVFGTVALKVGHTPLDDRWHRVERARVTGAPARYASALRSRDESARVEAINSYVNRRVTFADDHRQYGRADVWSTANTTLSRGRGDCEDYAIAKIQLLRAAGFAERDLYLVVLRDLVRRADHAVAVVRTGNRMVVLDNGTDRILDSDAVSDYRPVLTFAANGAWTHGYRVETPPVAIASAQSVPAPPITLASAEPVQMASLVPAVGVDDQRSRSASLRAFSTGFRR
jgi:predicted transglutaminase-like cysteine proteinase